MIREYRHASPVGTIEDSRPCRFEQNLASALGMRDGFFGGGEGVDCGDRNLQLALLDEADGRRDMLGRLRRAAPLRIAEPESDETYVLEDDLTGMHGAGFEVLHIMLPERGMRLACRFLCKATDMGPVLPFRKAVRRAADVLIPRKS